MLQRQIENIPKELRDLPQWVGFLNDKTPMDCKEKGKYASSTNSETWCDFETAINASTQFGYAGVGFVIQPPYIGIDLDDCVDSNQLNSFAKTITAELDSYTEYSVSKTGIHIICRGEINRSLKRKEIEIYPTGRYFTVTGDSLPYLGEIRHRTEQISKILERYKVQEQRDKDWITKDLAELREGNRDNTFMAIAGSLWRRGYTKENMYSLLKPHADKCGFSDAELVAKIHGISRYSRAQSTEDVIVKSSFQDVIHMPASRDFMIEPYFPKGGISIIGGLGESGKTWLLLDLALEAARGGNWLGAFPVSPQKVLYVDLERSDTETAGRVQQLYRGKKLVDIPNLTFLLKSKIKINLDNSFAALKEVIREGKYSLVCIDSLIKLHTVDDISRSTLQPVFNRLKEIRDELGVTFVILEHEGKNVLDPLKQNSEPNAHDLMGSSSKVQEAESVLQSRQKGARTNKLWHTKNTGGGEKAPPCVFEVTDIEPKPNVATIVRVIS